MDDEAREERKAEIVVKESLTRLEKEGLGRRRRRSRKSKSK